MNAKTLNTAPDNDVEYIREVRKTPTPEEGMTEVIEVPQIRIERLEEGIQMLELLDDNEPAVLDSTKKENKLPEKRSVMPTYDTSSSPGSARWQTSQEQLLSTPTNSPTKTPIKPIIT